MARQSSRNPGSRNPACNNSNVQLKLHGLQPGKQSQAVRVKEEDVQRPIIAELTRLGYIVQQASVRYKYFWVTCKRCGHRQQERPQGGTGQTPGIADLLICSPFWKHPLLPASLWLHIEVKGSHTPFSNETQREHDKAGHIVVARQVATAVQACARFDAFMGRLPTMIRGDVISQLKRAHAEIGRLRELVVQNGGDPDTGAVYEL